MYHLETTAGLLSTALKTLKPLVEARNTIPILGAVLFEGARASTTNLDMMMSVGFGSIKAEGRACVAYSYLERIIRLIDKDAEIEIDVDAEAKATLTFPGGLYRLPGFDAADFPSLDMPATAATIGGITDKFKAALAFTSPSISTEETRYYLNGVYFDGQDGKHGVVATDGHRLSCYPLDFDAAALSGTILPRSAVAVLLNLPKPNTIRVGDGHRVEFQFDGVTLWTKTIDGTFPDWRRIVPKRAEAKQSAIFDRLSLQAATKRVMAAATERGRAIQFAFGDGRTAIGAKTLDASGIEYLDGVELASPAGGEISFNAAYVLTTLEQLKHNARVKMWVDDAGAPATITGADTDAKEFIILMPMRGDSDFARNELARLAAPLKAAA